MLTKGETLASRIAARRRTDQEATPNLRDEPSLKSALTDLLSKERRETKKIVDRHFKDAFQKVQ